MQPSGLFRGVVWLDRFHCSGLYREVVLLDRFHCSGLHREVVLLRGDLIRQTGFTVVLTLYIIQYSQVRHRCIPIPSLTFDLV